MFQHCWIRLNMRNQNQIRKSCQSCSFGPWKQPPFRNMIHSFVSKHQRRCWWLKFQQLDFGMIERSLIWFDQQGLCKIYQCNWTIGFEEFDSIEWWLWYLEHCSNDIEQNQCLTWFPWWRFGDFQHIDWLVWLKVQKFAFDIFQFQQ